MDNSRDKDLRSLYERFHDHTLSPLARKRAHRNFVAIQSQVKDRTLVKLRYRLIRAIQADDSEKIEQLIKHHSRKQGRGLPPIA